MFHGGLQVAPKDYVASCVARAESLKELHAIVRKSVSWHEFIAEVRAVPHLEELVKELLDVICDVDPWNFDDSELAEAIDSGELCEIGALAESDAWVDRYLMVDDSAYLAELPKPILDLASFPQTSPMTGYDPIVWHVQQLETIQEMAKDQGVELVNGQDLFDKLATWM